MTSQLKNIYNGPQSAFLTMGGPVLRFTAKYLEQAAFLFRKLIS